MASQPLILVPGLLCDEDLWRDQLPALAPHADVTVTMEQTRHASVGDGRVELPGPQQRFELDPGRLHGLVSLFFRIQTSH